jgi:peptide/nickel transport system permease protein
MVGYALTRIAVALWLIWAVATLVFLVIHLVPGDPAELLLAQGGVAPDPAAVAELREKLGLDQPTHVQYLSYVLGLLKGDLGSSLLDDHSVAGEIALRLPRTLELIVAAGLMATLFGLPLGTVAALRAGGLADRVLATAAGLGLAVPVFVVGTIAVLVFAQKLRLVPAGGFVPFSRDPARHLLLLLMPAGTLAVGLGAVVFRMTRTSVLEGLTPRRIVLHHVVRNALVPVVTVLALHLGSLLGGTVLVEFVFNWPGLSGTLVRAVEQRDYPEVVGIVLVISVVLVTLNLVVDLLYAVIDPRVRLN